MKNIYLLFNILAIIALFSCERVYENPYDRDCPAEIWTPENFSAEITNGNVLLTWNQSNDHFDGFMIERSENDRDWEKLLLKNIDNNRSQYEDTTALAGKTYYYRIYAIADLNKSNYCCSDKVKLPSTTPTVISNDVIGITYSSATFNGIIDYDGGEPVTECGFCISKSPNPTTTETKIISSLVNGSFAKTVTQLEEETTYYVRAYAINSNGIAYGNQKSFKTLTNFPTVFTNNVTKVTTTSATLNGEIDYTGNETITERGFCYATTEMPDINDAKVTAGTGIGEFSKDITGLKLGTTYYVRAYSICSKGITYGNVETLKTVYIELVSCEQTGSAMGVFHHDGKDYTYEFYYDEKIYMSGDTSYISECGVYSEYSEKTTYFPVSWIAPGYTTIKWTAWSTPDPNFSFTDTPYVKFKNGDYYMGNSISKTVVHDGNKSIGINSPSSYSGRFQAKMITVH